MKVRLISIILVVVMIVSICPFSVVAEINYNQYSITNTKNATGMDIVEEARKWANSGATYVPNDKIAWPEGVAWRTGLGSTLYFDCIGFVSRVLNDLGFRSYEYPTPDGGSQVALYNKYGSGYITCDMTKWYNYGINLATKLKNAKNGDFSDLCPGDIIGWVSDSGNHVFIYAGEVNGTPWMVEFTGSGYKDRAVTSDYMSKAEYAVRFAEESGTYISQCTTYPCSITVKITDEADCYAYTLPCNSDTAESNGFISKKLTEKPLAKGTILTASLLIKNTEGNYWYKVELPDDTIAYLYGTHCEKQDLIAPTIQNGSFPSNITGATNIIGTIATTGTLKTIRAVVYKGKEASGTVAITSNKVTINKSSYNLKNSEVDYSLPFQNLANYGNGYYTLTYEVEISSYYTNSSNTATNEIIGGYNSLGSYTFYYGDMNASDEGSNSDSSSEGASGLSYPPYPKVNYDYSSDVKCGTIRYIAQNTGSEYFSWNYWPTNSFGGYTGGPEIECGTACISMALSYVGINRTPKDLLIATNGYTSNMWVDQDSATSRSITISKAGIAAAMDDYINGNGKFSPLCIYIQPFSSTSAMHWVLLVGKISDNTYLALNPWHSSGTNGTFTIQINGSTATYNGLTNPITSVNQWYNSEVEIESEKASITLNSLDGSVWSVITCEPESYITLLPQYPKVEGYYFSGWSKTNNSSTVEYHPNDIIYVDETLTLYPVYVSHAKAISGEEVLIYDISDFYAENYDITPITSETYVINKLINKSYWTEWSDYSLNEVTATDSVEVKTTTLYRYYYFYCSSCGRHEPYSGTCDCGKSLYSSDFVFNWFEIPYSQSNSKKYSYMNGEKSYTESLGDGKRWNFSTANINSTVPGTTSGESVIIDIGYSYRTYVEEYDTQSVSLTAYKISPKHVHLYNSVVTQPSCTSQGYTTHTCSCGHSYVDSYTAKADHSYGEWYQTVAPTCTAKGTERRNCTNCSAYETREKEANGHSYTFIVIAPSCTTDGYTIYSCSCGDTYKANYINALGHFFGNWYETKAPTCTEKGAEQRDCNNCKHFEMRDVAATGHSYISVVTAPSCTSGGFTTYTCHCGDTYKADHVNATGHSYSNGNCTSCGASDPDHIKTDAKITANDVISFAGDTIEIPIVISNNPGIVSMLLTVTYDESVLTLVEVKDTGLITGAMHTPALDSPYLLTWINSTITDNITSNGTVATLVFEIAENAETGVYPISISYDYENYDIVNVDMDPVLFETVDSTLTITDWVYGDVNRDGRINLLDSTILARYVAKWPNYTADALHLSAADVNNDGRVNLLDSTILARHIAKWPGYIELPFEKNKSFL